MARLKTLSSRLSPVADRFGRVAGDRAGYDRQREHENVWRKWYRTKRWSDLRLAILIRDGWRCRKTGEPLIGKGNAPNAPVIHHETPHNGDPVLFWAEGNLVAVAKAWHDGEGQKADRSQGHW